MEDSKNTFCGILFFSLHIFLDNVHEVVYSLE